MCAPDAFVSRGNFSKRNFNNADAFTTVWGNCKPWTTSQKRERKNWQTTFFLLRLHRQMCLELLAMKNGCLVAGFGICQRHKVQHQHTMPTEAVATWGLVIFIILHLRPSRNRQIGCCP